MTQMKPDHPSPGVLDDTLLNSRDNIRDEVVGRRIVAVGHESSDDYGSEGSVVLTLDSGSRVLLREMGDCCAFTSVTDFALRIDSMDHVITDVTTDKDFRRWHIVAGMVDVLTMDVDWSDGSGYYAYGFEVTVEPIA